MVVLVATSGDTGGAVARAFWRRAGIEVVLLYPSGRISRLQEQQLTALGDNIHAVEVAGSFDDCQRLVKQALVDRELVSRRAPVPGQLDQPRAAVAAGVLLHLRRPAPARRRRAADLRAERQLRQPHRRRVRGPVGPAGGRLLGRHQSATTWYPATSTSGALLPRASVATLSNAMDVGNPSNFERILARWNHDHAAVSAHLKGCAIGEHETLATMRQVHEQHGRLIDPHTAVGVAAARRLRAQGACFGAAASPVVVLATADAGKFPETVQRATGVVPPVPAPLQELLERPKQATPLEPSFPALRAFILAQTAAGSRGR